MADKNAKKRTALDDGAVNQVNGGGFWDILKKVAALFKPEQVEQTDETPQPFKKDLRG